MKKVLILCTGNSCRSQMAEGLWQNLGKGEWSSFSAGSKPAGYVHPLAIAAMKELGFDISNHKSKSLAEYQNDTFDLVITVCDNAKDECPVFHGAKKTLHWPFEDPAHAEGTDDQKMTEFRRIRDEIKDTIERFLEG